MTYRAKVELEYAQRQIKVGETFEVEPEHVNWLLALDRIEKVEKPKQQYMTRQLTARKKGTQ